MAEQINTAERDTSGWLNSAKEKIKNAEQSKAMERINELKHLTVKSVNDTLVELKLKKYEGSTTCFTLSSAEVTEKLNNEWSVLKLNEWKGPTINEEMQSTEYLSQSMQQYDDECESKYDLLLNHIFWEFALKKAWNYCEVIASEIFDRSPDVQLLNTLRKCLSICCLLDTFKARKLSKQTFINSINLQNIVNQQFGTKLDIEKWEKTDDDKKVYKRCAVMIQKEAMKAGKAFTKLHKVYKIQRRKEKKKIKVIENNELLISRKEKKKQVEETEKNQNEETPSKPTPTQVTQPPVVKQEEEAPQIQKEEEKREETQKEEEKEEEKEENGEAQQVKEIEKEIKTEPEHKEQPSSNNTYLFALAVVVALCLIILAVLTQRR